MDATGAGTVPLQDLGTNAYPTTLAIFPYSLERKMREPSLDRIRKVLDAMGVDVLSQIAA